MANSLNAYKLDDQTLKLVKEAKKEVFPMQVKIKGNNGETHAGDDSLAPLLEPPLNMYPLLPENDLEAWDEEFDNQSNTESHPLLMRI